MTMRRIIPTVDRKIEKKIVDELFTDLLTIDKSLPNLVSEALKSNPSKGMPYHNNLHTILFLKSVMLLIKDSTLIPREKMSLLAAALYHDYNYLSTGHDDTVNIRSAIDAWRNDLHLWCSFDVDSNLVMRLIESTELSKDLSVNDKDFHLKGIMRDADILGWIFKEYSEPLYAGLEKEKGIKPYAAHFTKHFKFYSDRSLGLIKEAGLA